MCVAKIDCYTLESCSDPSKGFICDAQGYTTHFFCVASFLWTTTIAFTLHRTVVKHKTDVEDLEAMFHLYVWGMHKDNSYVGSALVIFSMLKSVYFCFQELPWL